jgi:PAS domain S-box-containing protein
MPPASERLLTQVLDGLPGGIAILDTTGRVVTANQAWRDLGAAGALCGPGLGAGADYLEACDRVAGADATAAAVASGIRALAAGGPGLELDYPGRGPADRRWFSLRAARLELDGRPRLLVRHHDVTERVSAELALKESEARLRLALGAGRMGTWDVDLRTGAEAWNEVHYRLFGVDPAGFTPSSAAFMALVHPSDRERMRALAEDVLAGRVGPEFDNDYRVVLPDGGVRWIGGGGRLLRDAEGRPERLLGVSFDITERKQRELELEEARAALAGQAGTLEARNRELEEARLAAEEARREAEAAGRAKAEFLAAMSHEVRTPLTGVLGMAELLAAEPLGAKQKGYVEAIRTSGRHLLSVVNDVLDFSRLEAGGLELERVDFSVLDVLEQVRSLMAPQLVARGLELHFGLDEHSPPVVRGDPTRLMQVLLNLIGNGLKFTHHGGVTVRLRGGEAAGERLVRLRFEVEDTGIGMTGEQVAGLFRPFAQADRSITRRYGGSGLGLAISKRLVEAMGGAIGVESAPGEGSLFWFEVPLELGDAVVLTGRAALAPAAVPPLHVLVAEDVELNRDLLADVLGRHGHEVVFATDGEEAVGLASRGGFDLVLMDAQMPVMDGVEATRRIRALEGPAGRVPIVGLTANVMERDRRLCLAAGMQDCLGKPIDWARLFAAMARHAGGAGPAREETGAPSPEARPGSSSGPGPTAGPAEAEAGGSPGPAPAAEAAETPLLDRGMLDRLGATLPAEAFAGLVRRGIENAERACARLPTLPAGSEEQVREAHSLKGTAGTFGLRRVSAVAGEIEAAALEGGDVSGLVERLAAAVAATRAELRETGLLPG